MRGDAAWAASVVFPHSAHTRVNERRSWVNKPVVFSLEGTQFDQRYNSHIIYGKRDMKYEGYTILFMCSCSRAERVCDVMIG